jgi:hypothetical protein
MKTAEFFFSDTIRFHPDIPVKKTFNVPMTGLRSIPELPVREQKAKLTPQQEWFRHIAIDRNKKWREEQTLLIDTSRYIRTNINISLVQKDYKAYDIKLPSRQIEHTYNNWFTIFLFFTLILLTIVNRSFVKYLSSLFRSIFNYPTASRMFREQNISIRQGSLLMEFFYLLILSLFGYQIMNHFGFYPSTEGFVKFIIILLAVSLFFLIKTFIYKTLGYIYETQPETGEYLFNMKNYSKVLGILLLPVVGLIAWAPVNNPTVFLITGVALMAILYLLTLRRGVKILLKKQFSIFYLFLYLCTLEFLPLLLFLKVVS